MLTVVPWLSQGWAVVSRGDQKSQPHGGLALTIYCTFSTFPRH